MPYRSLALSKVRIIKSFCSTDLIKSSLRLLFIDLQELTPLGVSIVFTFKFIFDFGADCHFYVSVFFTVYKLRYFISEGRLG